MLSPTVFWRIAEDIPKKLSWTLIVLSIAIPIALWWLVSEYIATHYEVYAIFLPTPLRTLEALQRLWSEGILLTDIAYSMFRVFSGFFLAALISVPLGVLMGAFASWRSLLEPMDM
ncbi:MAG: hypothetical protein HC840_29790 [Leptolyngbyaceae cyanobacterium RM2_2_4]|nr:hypothetical protein [Leptolyngbyaceae cyanobacterium RM2_2_4]